MKTRSWRLLKVSVLLLCVGCAVGLVLYALQQNINLFYTPTQVVLGEAPLQKRIRLGGMVRRGSVVQSNTGLAIQFTVTDFEQDVRIDYEGILPDLFREGQGVVALGQLVQKGHFVADQVLAKHDEKYMPPEVASGLKISSSVDGR